MWSAVQPAAVFFFLWLLAVTALFMVAERLPAGRRGAGTLLLIAAAVRLPPALLLPVGAAYDIISFEMAAEALVGGNEVYAAVSGRYPYLPFYLYLIGFARLLAGWSGLPFVVWLKIWPVLADLALVWLIYRAAAARPESRPRAFTYGLLYALSPVALLVSAYHGQFDPLPVFFMMAAWFAWEFSRRYAPSAVLLGLAVASKTWPVILLPLLFLRAQPWRRRLGYAALTLAVPAGFVLFYLAWYRADPNLLLGRALTHAGSPGYWSISSVLAILSQGDERLLPLYYRYLSAGRWPVLIFGGLSLLLTVRQPVHRALLTVLLTIFTVTTGMAMQWLVWLFPAAILDGEWRWLKWYTAAGLIYLVVHLYGIHLVSWLGVWFAAGPADVILRLASLPTWFVVTAWTLTRYRALLAGWPGAPSYARSVWNGFREW